MNQPLASAAGNALEVANAVDFLTGKQDARLRRVTLALAGEMLVIGGLCQTRDQGVAKAAGMLDSGHAAEVFGQMVSALGGPADFVENHGNHLAKANLTRVVKSPKHAHVARIDTRGIGLAVVELGGGRRRADDVINPAVGLTGLIDLAKPVLEGEPLCTIHADNEAQAEAAERHVLAAFEIGAFPDAPEDPVLKIID